MNYKESLFWKLNILHKNSWSNCLIKAKRQLLKSTIFELSKGQKNPKTVHFPSLSHIQIIAKKDISNFFMHHQGVQLTSHSFIILIKWNDFILRTTYSYSVSVSDDTYFFSEILNTVRVPYGVSDTLCFLCGTDPEKLNWKSRDKQVSIKKLKWVKKSKLSAFHPLMP